MGTGHIALDLDENLMGYRLRAKMTTMRKAIVVAVMLVVVGCGGSEPAITILPRADMSTSAVDASDGVDQSLPPDLAWTDLAGGVDIAAPVGPDMTFVPVDMACGYVIGQSCTLNTQCACTKRGSCDITGDSYLHCCVFKGDACTKNADCCQRTGAGTGFCNNGSCL